MRNTAKQHGSAALPWWLRRKSAVDPASLLWGRVTHTMWFVSDVSDTSIHILRAMAHQF